MNRNLILKTDILDIIFENRNKAYGAYELRKYYSGRLKTALGFMMMFAALFSAFTLLPEKHSGVLSKPYIFTETILTKTEIPVPEPEKKQEAVKAETKTTPVNQQKFVSNPTIVASDVKADTIRTLSPDTRIGSENVNVPDAAAVTVKPVNSEPGPGTVSVPPLPGIDRSMPMDINSVDVPPAFPGGLDGLKNFLERNLNNPYDLENGETINVRIQFVVGYNGKLQSFTTVFDGGDIYNKEVIRVLKKMPDWQPGKAKGENVSVYYTIPVKFVMSD